MARAVKKCGYQGDPSKAHGGALSNGKAKAAKKKTRGPAKIIPMPSSHNGKGKAREIDPDAAADEEGEDMDSEEEGSSILDAEDMVGDGSSDSGEDEEEKGDSPVATNGKASSSRPNMDFLTSIDVKAISTSRAEQARLRKEEKKRQKSEMKAIAKVHKQQSRRATSEQGGNSDAESVAEDYDFEEGEGQSELGFDSEESLLSEEDLDSDDLEEEEDSDEDLDEEEAEDRLASRVAAQAKRKAAEEEMQSSRKAKKAKLPVRGENGWLNGHAGGDEVEEDSGAETPGNRVLRTNHVQEDSEEEASGDEAPAPVQPRSTVAMGSRFGMLAPYSVMQIQPKANRIVAAREQIARLAQSVISDPEVTGLGFLKRMAVFAKMKVAKPVNPDEQPSVKAKKAAQDGDDEEEEEEDADALPIDTSIRAAAILSLMAVYSDVLPGYRIRPLTDAEQAEKVSQEVRRRREFEQGIVSVYREFLELCEKQIKAKHELSAIALKAVTTLLLRAPNFNYRTNIIRTVVAKLSRASWDDESALCASTLVQLQAEDNDGEISLEIVRLLHRMIKERRYKVHAAVLDILLHLRLKDELGDKRASTTHASGDKTTQAYDRKAKPSEVRKKESQHLSKKQVKKLREMKEIEKEMREADAVVDLEERERNQTETLKLLFVLYFAILKSETASSALLGSALEGLAMFAHRINVDFFRDLLAVLRDHVQRARIASQAQDTRRLTAQNGSAEDEGEEVAQHHVHADLRDALLCVVTAFELLSGQGEAINIDLSDMASHLYAIMLQLSTSTNVEETPVRTSLSTRGGARKSTHLRSCADLVFRALELLLLRTRASTLSSERSAAFVKRLLLCSMHWPATSVIRAMRMIKVMIARDTRLAALFDSEDLARNGKFDPLSDSVDSVRPLACGESAWELLIIRRSANADVRAEVAQLLQAAADAAK